MPQKEAQVRPRRPVFELCDAWLVMRRTARTTNANCGIEVIMEIMYTNLQLASLSLPRPRDSRLPRLSDNADDSILSRLRKLEQAVFGPAPSNGTGFSMEQFADFVDPERSERPKSSQRRSLGLSTRHSQRRRFVDNERQQTAKFLDSTFTRNGLNVRSTASGSRCSKY